MMMKIIVGKIYGFTYIFASHTMLNAKAITTTYLWLSGVGDCGGGVPLLGLLKRVGIHLHILGRTGRWKFRGIF